MTEHTRRTLLASAAATAATSVLTKPAAADVAPARAEWPPPLHITRITQEDPRYDDLVHRGNGRFAGTPDVVYVVGSTEQVVDVVTEAVHQGRRIATRSGGHCYEDFVDNPSVRAIIDLSGMTRIYYDPRRRAFAVEPGATLGELYRMLHLGWDVTVPAGWHPLVGVGGHILGGGYGALGRAHGLAVDHLYAVEVVVVDRSGKAHAVYASRDPDDKNHDLWWAHTGGGGGNFGIVTRYWLRSPEATGDDPTGLLPLAPTSMLHFSLDWNWDDIDEHTLTRLLTNHGSWFEAHSAPNSPDLGVYSELTLFRKPFGSLGLSGEVIDEPGADQRLTDHLAAVTAGIGAPSTTQRYRLRWSAATHQGIGEDGKGWRMKVKSAYQRKRLTLKQIRTIHHYLTRTDYTHPHGAIGFNAYGGRINAVGTTATATSHRDSILSLVFMAGWDDPAEDDRHLTWIREFYRDVYADTGGVPVPGGASDGAYINIPDTDLADPAWNTSNVAWYRLYYKENYPRLQRIKGRWDPLDVFRHALSIRPA
ncbi:FAD-linked oxidase [Actinosynnema sp. ALI-1.44]|uniref:FAD-binding oxidoreductase n=1 Tax=Actinosynnema sp. ALI-1.44 TaxID=1933779 RepID=UPI00097C17AA|nr:FAD-binding protein [Actinosynnema sp. ALI-1.44]ONI76366.1 FAD-linked oxidase [Actinosynnema sp. ALI-1.44]